jgi:hypothetical protein
MPALTDPPPEAPQPPILLAARASLRQRSVDLGRRRALPRNRRRSPRRKHERPAHHETHRAIPLKRRQLRVVRGKFAATIPIRRAPSLCWRGQGWSRLGEGRVCWGSSPAIPSLIGCALASSGCDDARVTLYPVAMPAVPTRCGSRCNADPARPAEQALHDDRKASGKNRRKPATSGDGNRGHQRLGCRMPTLVWPAGGRS